MRVALDTNRYVDLCKGVADTLALLEEAEAIMLPFVVVGELRAGYAHGRRQAENERVLRRFLLKDGVRIIAAKPKDIPAALRGQRGEIRSAVVIFDEGGEARVAGPVSLDSTGLLDGDITVTFKDGDKLGQALARAIPEAASVIKPALSAAALAAGKDKEASLILTIRKGRVSAGFIPIGNIPAL